ncbi:MAG: DUF971 domain-containing protein [Candidatus Lambdaproteobacteria bacterium]|nr:DUF971 domain-containing protein [Candidatus Lambdaproteobacteria bacterium]
MATDLARRKPKDIVYEHDLTVEWRDGVIAHYPFFALRAACPCAGCVDELTGTRTLKEENIPKDVTVRTAEYVGNYALQFFWSDNHNTGIYSFRYLRELYDLANARGGGPEGPHSLKS